ncbi:hypothetical protein [Geodermatophilus amargosae]|uniref:hypothetical protein n=1 Tax=Geodermatophilus amargosae TaxID=1296565 RepID=UPI001C3174ED|nr:hypothetical protein [Geodermatophilus amargosae]
MCGLDEWAPFPLMRHRQEPDGGGDEQRWSAVASRAAVEPGSSTAYQETPGS